jgi:hypothetical protein
VPHLLVHKLFGAAVVTKRHPPESAKPIRSTRFGKCFCHGCDILFNLRRELIEPFKSNLRHWIVLWCVALADAHKESFGGATRIRLKVVIKTIHVALADISNRSYQTRAVSLIDGAVNLPFYNRLAQSRDFWLSK